MSRIRPSSRPISTRILSRPLSVCQCAAPCRGRAEAKHWTQTGLRAGLILRTLFTAGSKVSRRKTLFRAKRFQLNWSFPEPALFSNAPWLLPRAWLSLPHSSYACAFALVRMPCQPPLSLPTSPFGQHESWLSPPGSFFASFGGLRHLQFAQVSREAGPAHREGNRSFP